MHSKVKVVFFGTPQFAADVLQHLIDHQVSVVAVVSKPDRAKGRSKKPMPTPVKLVAEKHKLPLYQPQLASDPEFAKIVDGYDADLFVVVAYGEIIKQNLLDMPKIACINVHASLLPAYRGAAPIHRCLINGEKETGVTIMHMVKKMDAGEIIAKESIPIDQNITFGELQDELCTVGKRLLLDVLKKGNFEGTEQDHEKATFAPRIELEDCEIAFDQPAEHVHNLIRGSSPTPGAWCVVKVRGEKKRLKIFRSEIVYGRKGFAGELLAGGIVACKENALKLVEVQLEGKKRMRAQDLFRGIPETEIVVV